MNVTEFYDIYAFLYYCYLTRGYSLNIPRIEMGRKAVGCCIAPPPLPGYISKQSSMP
jgi:hypothetical protein